MKYETIAVQICEVNRMDDTISRQAAIEAVYKNDSFTTIKQRLEALPPAQPEHIQNNAVHLCDSCQYTIITCPSHGNDAIFGDGKGNDNICACNKYRPISAQPEHSGRRVYQAGY